MQLLKKVSLLALSSIVILSSCEKENDNEVNNPSEYDTSKSGSLLLMFDTQAGSEDFVFGENYTTALGESFALTKFQYYVSNVKLTAEDGSVYTVPTTKNSGYYFIKEGVNTSVSINDIPENNYVKIDFIVGVDSLRNTMDPAEREGVLDIGDQETGADMYWSWNSGYIFLKFEGTSPEVPDSTKGKYVQDENGNWYTDTTQYTQLEDKFEIHIGGYGGYQSPMPNNNRAVQLDAPTGNSLQVREDANAMGHIKVDVLDIMDGTVLHSFSQYYSVHSPMKTSSIADNYSNMFTLHHVSN